MQTTYLNQCGFVVLYNISNSICSYMLYFLKLQDNSEVHLFSANPRTKNRVVAIGTLMSQDKTYVVGGNMLGEEYFGVLINRLTDISDEKLPRPYKDIETVRDAFGHVIAWPKFIVSTILYVQALQCLISFDACLLFYELCSL
jgi:hypothetical protein